MSVLAARLDGPGDVLLSGPAVRALAASGPVDLLVGPAAVDAAALLPGVRDVLVLPAPWDGPPAAPVDAGALEHLVDVLRRNDYDEAVVFTGTTRSPLPLAVLLRLAGVGRVSGASEDYPGSLLDVRFRRPAGCHELDAALDLAAAAGHHLPPGDDGGLRVRDVPAAPVDLPRDFVVVHPGAGGPGRALPAERATALVEALRRSGHEVVVTGRHDERGLTAAVAGSRAVDLGGRTDLAGLAGVLAAAEAVVVAGGTVPALLAAAVGTPLVPSPAATRSPVPGHPVPPSRSPRTVLAAVEALARPAWPTAPQTVPSGAPS